jgi:hypothetical protein
MGEATTDPVRLPPMLRIPKIVQALALVAGREKAVGTLARRCGTAFTLNLPIVGEAVVISDPTLIKDLFTTSGDLVGRRPSNGLGKLFGPGSTFSLDGDEHRKRRKLLVPPFHGKRMQAYEHIIEEEVMRETSNWPEGSGFETLPSMMRITLNAILRAVFGAEGAAFDELRELLPAMVLLGSRFAVLREVARRALGVRGQSAQFQRYRRRYDALVGDLISDALADPAFEQRGDVLSLMLRARYDDGSRISNDHIADELLTLLLAGHETTATTLAWSVERLRRHPQLLRRLTEEVDAGGSQLRQATIQEVQRSRPVIRFTARMTKERIRLGEWVIPERGAVIVNISAAHTSAQNFPDPNSFVPDRFLGAGPANYTWIPFGGGIHRCIGAAFANMEMDVTLRTLLRKFEFRTTNAPGERHHSRGVAIAPGRGGRAVVYRRPPVNESSLLGDKGCASEVLPAHVGR